MFVQLSLVKEWERGGRKWTSFFERVWPFYQKWFLSEGYLKRPGYLTSKMAFQDHMPKLVDVYDELCEAVGGEDVKARFLSMYCPPAYMSGCSQIAWTRNGNALIRNYDYHPRYFDGMVFYSNFLKPVIGMSDCTWGLLDGINAEGLAVSLTFGGKRIVGNGFGIPIIIRYLLETCSNVKDAISTIKNIPSHMAYNLTLLDSEGNLKSVYLCPEKQNVVVNDAITTNHQTVIEWPEYAKFTRTLERKSYLENCLRNRNEDVETMANLFLKAPLYHSDYERSFGTLYTAVYKTSQKEISYRWPRKKINLNFKSFKEGKLQINLKKIMPKHI